MDLDFLMEWENKIYIVANFNDFPQLHEENVPYTLETFNFFPFKHTRRTLQGGVNGAYHSYRELEQDLFALEDSYPNLAKVSVIGESLEGRNIYALKISDNVNNDEAEAEVLFTGCHHAREWISVEIPFLLGSYLLENYASDPQVQNLVNQSEIWIVPLVNPDGLYYSIHFYRYWRKNRRNNGDGTYGIDLNRNYGYQWGYDNTGSTPYTFSETYRGPSAFSEPETQAIRNLFAQRNFNALISYHSYSQVILYPWGYMDQPSADDLLLEQIATDMSTRIQSVNGNIYGYMQSGESFYLTNGDTTDWSYGVYGIPSFTIELPPADRLQGQFFNAEEDIQSIFNDNLPAMFYLVDWAVQNSSPPGGSSEEIRRTPGIRLDVKQEFSDERAEKKRKLAQNISRERSARKKSYSPRIKPIGKQNLSQNDPERKQKKKKILKE
jgi:murein tripeptide amidase MpaA